MPDIDKCKFKYYQIEKQFKEGFVEIPEIPEYIVNNLNHKFELREYQKEAFSKFITYFEDDRLTIISKFGLCFIVQQVVEKP